MSKTAKEEVQRQPSLKDQLEASKSINANINGEEAPVRKAKPAPKGKGKADDKQ